MQRALVRSREGDILSRTWREVRGEPILTDLDAKVSYSRRRSAAWSRGCSATSTVEPVDASVDLEQGSVDPEAVQDGPRCAPPACAATSSASCWTPASAACAVRTRVVEPEVSTKQLAEKYPAVVVVNRGAFKLTLYKNLKPAKTYGIAVGQVGLETPAGLYHIQNKAVDPAWTMPNSDWVAPKDRGKVVPGGHGGEPAQGPLAGHLRRGRHPRHRRGELDRHGRLARLRPDAHPGRDRALRPGPGRRADLHRLARRLGRNLPHGDLLPPPSSREAWWSPWRSTSVPMNTPLSRLRITAYHMVDASRVPWIRCQGSSGCSSGATTPASTSWRWVAT